MTPRGRPNPIINADFPDPDIIRVGEVYYMATTTMHFMPGCAILRSRDLLDWEFAAHVYAALDDAPGRHLAEGASAYGQGMWAASLRHHRGTFYVLFIANDTRKTYLFEAARIEGPWKGRTVEGFYHDPSLLFDDDGRVYVAYGNRDIYLTELDAALRGPRPGGLHRLLIRDDPAMRLGFEGSHLYKVRGRYYLFLIHWHPGPGGMRAEACYSADSLEGEFRGGDILVDDMGFHGMGVAQGGVVDTPAGDWYAMLFQDRGALGRVPVLLPLRWEGDEPRIDGVPRRVAAPDAAAPTAAAPDAEAALPAAPPPAASASGTEPLFGSDDFRRVAGAPVLGHRWEWNHVPDDSLWAIDGERGHLAIRTGRLDPNVTRARNVLTQRMAGPRCAAAVRVDGSLLRDGDFAGLCALQGRYGLVALAREGGRFFAVMRANPGEAIMEMGRTMDLTAGVEYARVPVPGPELELRLAADFRDMADLAEFSHRDGNDWVRIGPAHKLRFGLDHFTGCRFGLFAFSTQAVGGEARFREFRYELDGE